MKIMCKNLMLGLASSALLTLYGCGGGGASLTTDVPVTVIDGPIRNAVVCLDKNANGVCDAGEPTARTDAAGKTTLQIDNADVGKFAVLAEVGTDAIDTDRPTTPITTPFTMTAPADKPAVISPLTTLVQTLVQDTGMSSNAAEAQLKSQTGLKVSLFEDFIAIKTADHQTAGTLARMLVVATQQNIEAIKDTKNRPASDGNLIKASDIDKLIQVRLIEILSNVMAALAANPSLAANVPVAAKEDAIKTQTTVLLAVPGNAITPASVAGLVGIANATALVNTEVVSTPVAGLNLRALTFTDVSNWFVHAFTLSAAQNTPDGAGNVKFVERRANSVAGEVASWNVGREPRQQSDLSFNGTAWANCPLNFENTATVINAAGKNSYNYCNNRETGINNRAKFDLKEKTMISVYQQVNDAGYTNLTIANAVAALGTTVFPAGSTLLYQTSTMLSSVNTYNPGTDNIVKQYSAAISGGGLAKDQSSGVACNAPEFNFAATTPSATLEAMVASMTGTPCVINHVPSFSYNDAIYSNPDSTTESWANSTLGVGMIGTAPVGSGEAPGFYTSNQLIRMAFKGSGINPVTYYSCKQRFDNGRTRNCSVIGTGNYTITTQGDARVLTMSNSPAVANPLKYERVFVERGGKVFFGYKNNLTVSKTARLNKTASDALFAKLGLPAVNTDTPLALTRASYQGVWDVSSVQFPLVKTVLTISNRGITSCQETDTSATPPRVTTQACVITFKDLPTGEFTASTPGNTGSASGTINFLTGALNGTAVDGIVTETLLGARR